MVAERQAQHRLATLESQYLRTEGELWVEIYVTKELKWERVMSRCRFAPPPFYAPLRRLATPAGLR